MRTKVRILIEVFEDGSTSTTVYDHSADIDHLLKARDGLEEARRKLESKFDEVVCGAVLLI